MSNFGSSRQGAMRQDMTRETMKIPINYEESSEILKKTLGLNGSPVAIAFATSKDEIPPGVPELEKTIRHCMMVWLARKEGKTFYAPVDKHECNGGAWALEIGRASCRERV